VDGKISKVARGTTGEQPPDLHIPLTISKPVVDSLALERLVLLECMALLQFESPIGVRHLQQEPASDAARPFLASARYEPLDYTVKSRKPSPAALAQTTAFDRTIVRFFMISEWEAST
jgi:hypothetical protein